MEHAHAVILAVTLRAALTRAAQATDDAAAAAALADARHAHAELARVLSARRTANKAIDTASTARSRLSVSEAAQAEKSPEQRRRKR